MDSFLLKRPGQVAQHLFNVAGEQMLDVFTVALADFVWPQLDS